MTSAGERGHSSAVWGAFLTMPIFRYVWPLVRLAQRHGSPEKAGQRVAFLAWSPWVDEYTGAYFEGRPHSEAALGP